VRGGVVVAVAVLAAVAACGSSAATRPQAIHFGFSGGNILGSTASIRPNGAVRVRLPDGTQRSRIPVSRVRKLDREIRRAHLSSRVCPGTNPDFAGRFIRLGRRTVTVRGGCEPRFERVWSDLTKAVGRFPA
jgi:hypothetical protein